MKKIKYILLFFCLAACFSSCKKNLEFENFDFEAQFKKDTIAIRAFAIANNIPILKDAQSNVFYQIIEPGSGDILNSLSQVSVIYSGRLLNGTKFDSNTTPSDFWQLSKLIKGWELGIPLIRKGGKIRLLLPSIHGYQNIPYGSIPANSVLDFDITLVDVK